MKMNGTGAGVTLLIVGLIACREGETIDAGDGGTAGENGGASSGGQPSGGTGGTGGVSNLGGHTDGGATTLPLTRDLDVVFVIDNSASMREEQANLRQNFPAFIEELGKLPGGLPNLHIGVLSSDVGAGNIAISGNPACNRPGGNLGVFQARADCGLTPNARFLTSGGAANNFTGSLQDAFACIADLGTQGCGFEHQLQSLRVGLSNITPQNAGFLRPGAALLVVILTDEDDCSAPPDTDLFVDPAFAMGQQASTRCGLVGHQCNGQPVPATDFSAPLLECNAIPNGGGRLIPVSEFVTAMRNLKPGAVDRIFVSAIAGWPADPATAQYALARDPMRMNLLDVQPACSSLASGSAAPALRIKSFVEGFGVNGTLETICNGDLRPALTRIAAKVARVIAPAP